MAALEGIRVLDLTTVIFGPYASQVLADYGAEVIKLESFTGDSTRYTGPAQEQGMSAMFLSVNRNKKSIAVDLKTPEGIAIIKDLLKTCDVFMHNIRPQKIAKIGLSYEDVKALNPELIYAGLYGFGSDGPYAGRPAYDDIIQGLSGVPDLILKQSGTPRYMPTIAADKSCALIAAHAILAALFQRTRTQQGQFIEIPMFESMVSFTLLEHYYDQHLVDMEPLKQGYARVLSEHRKPYTTSDGYLCVMPYTDKHWQTLFKATGNPDLADDPRFSNIAERTRHINELYDIVGKLMLTRTTQEWLAFFEEHDIPNAAMNTLASIGEDPHLQAVGFFQDIQDSSGHYRFLNNPVYMEQSKVDVQMPPRLGEHTQEILQGLGISSETLNSLYSNNIIK
ncbi:MAG: CoA transferase [Pelistega sp.]|nr:CoA transferase [Pelistega sp.]